MLSGNTTTVSGTLTSTPTSTYLIEVFANNVGTKAAAEGEIFIGSTIVTTDGRGVIDFDGTSHKDVVAGQFITATATSVRNAEEVESVSVAGIGQRLLWDTSEFSVAIELEESPNQIPVANAGGPYFVGEGSSIELDGSRSTDPDLTTLTFQWDLDGDNVFGETGSAAGRGDEVGAKPTFLAAGLNGFAGSSVTVALRVTDDYGATE